MNALKELVVRPGIYLTVLVSIPATINPPAEFRLPVHGVTLLPILTPAVAGRMQRSSCQSWKQYQFRAWSRLLEDR